MRTRMFQWVLAAILICGASVFTACSNEDRPLDENPATTDLNVAEKIMGKWMKSDKNGQPLPTDGKMVYTFVSPTKAYMSASIDASPEVGTHWIDQLESDVTISGNKVSLTSYSEEGATMVVDYIITAIDDKEFTANHKVTITLGGTVVYVVEDVLRFEKVTTDYAADIVGMWECQEITGGETYNDPNARLAFKADGTYNFYRRDDAGLWQTVTTREFQDYFVDGYLVNTRWKDADESESREWWEIAELSGDEMRWVALRKNADGTTFEQGAKWKRVESVTSGVYLTQIHQVSTYGNILVTATEDYVWENGLLRSSHGTSYMSMTNKTIDTGVTTYIYDSNNNCIEQHHVSDSQNDHCYFTYEGNRMTRAVELNGTDTVGKVTINGYTPDGHIQALTVEKLLTGRITDYEITWKNGDMTSFLQHPVVPADEDLVYDIKYDDYPNTHTGFPLTDAVFDPQMIAGKGSLHNWFILDKKYTYSNGLLVRSTSSNGTTNSVTYYTYSDGTTGRE